MIQPIEIGVIAVVGLSIIRMVSDVVVGFAPSDYDEYSRAANIGQLTMIAGISGICAGLYSMPRILKSYGLTAMGDEDGSDEDSDGAEADSGAVGDEADAADAAEVVENAEGGAPVAAPVAGGS